MSNDPVFEVRSARAWWWWSFVETNRDDGDRFVGVVVIESCCPGHAAEGILAASLDIPSACESAFFPLIFADNPDYAVVTMVLEPWRLRLLSRAECEELDEQLLAIPETADVGWH